MSAKQKHTHETRETIVFGSHWIPFLPCDRRSPMLTVQETPLSTATEVRVSSYGGRTYDTRVTSLLEAYRLAPADAAPIVPETRPAVARPGLVHLPEPVAAEPIVPAPEDLGVRVYVFQGRPCVLAAAVGLALGYGDDGKHLADSITGNWSAEFSKGKAHDVLEGSELRRFKGVMRLSGGPPPGRAAAMMVLYEFGFGLVLQKTDKPEGQRLRRRLADEVLPKLRRGEPVGPAAASLPPAPAAPPALGMEARMEAMFERVITVTLPRLVASAIARALPAAPVGPPTVTVPRDWLSSEKIASRVTATKTTVDKILRDSKVRENPELARQVSAEWTDEDGQRHVEPRWMYAPSVLEMVRTACVPVKP